MTPRRHICRSALPLASRIGQYLRVGKRRNEYDGQSLETLDVGSDDAPGTRDRRPSRLSKRATSLVLLIAVIAGATIAVIVLVGWRNRVSPPSSSTNVGGTLREIGRGVNRPVAGVVTAIPSTGPRIIVRVGPSGNFRVKLVPGVYRFVGRSPSFDDGKRDCLAGGPVRLTLHMALGVLLGCMVH